jgi:hypothetical protein
VVRAKFRCISVTQLVGGKYNDEGKFEQGVVYNYRFQAVGGDSAENKSFYASTPNGSIELVAVRDDLFQIQKEYYLDFSLAEQ